MIVKKVVANEMLRFPEIMLNRNTYYIFIKFLKHVLTRLKIQIACNWHASERLFNLAKAVVNLIVRITRSISQSIDLKNRGQSRYKCKINTKLSELRAPDSSYLPVK